MDTFSIPFRFVGSQAAKHTEGTDEYYLHILSNVLQIEPGELPLEPNLGINDPTFSRITRASIMELATKYVPELRVSAVNRFASEDGTEEIVVTYTRT